MIEHHFTIEACRRASGVPSVSLPAQGVAMREIVSDALHALEMLMVSAHPAWSMSSDPNDWDVVLVDVVRDMVAENHYLLRWHLVPREGAITADG